MEVVGPKGWNDIDNYIVQTNNPTESFLKKLKNKISNVSYLQSCGPSTATCCASILVGYDNIVPSVRGIYKPQPEEVLMDFFSDPRFNTEFLKIRSNFDYNSIHFNEIPQYYPYAVKQVFAIDAEFEWLTGKDQVIAHLLNGCPVQACLKNPGHYISIIAYNATVGKFIYNDSWPNRHPDNNGFNRTMLLHEFEHNLKPFIIVYKGDLKK